MNKRIKKKKAKRQREYVILSFPKNNMPEWKRYKARIRLSKCYVKPTIPPSLNNVMFWIRGLSSYDGEIDE